MKYIKRVITVLIILSFLLLTGCSNKNNEDGLSYRIDNNHLIVMINEVEYDAGEVEYNSKDLKIKDSKIIPRGSGF